MSEHTPFGIQKKYIVIGAVVLVVVLILIAL